ncbi:hypothetical protein LguiB_035996 [Lonicera macranthoides]
MIINCTQDKRYIPCRSQDVCSRKGTKTNHIQRQQMSTGKTQKTKPILYLRKILNTSNYVEQKSGYNGTKKTIQQRTEVSESQYS